MKNDLDDSNIFEINLLYDMSIVEDWMNVDSAIVSKNLSAFQNSVVKWLLNQTFNLSLIFDITLHNEVKVISKS